MAFVEGGAEDGYGGHAFADGTTVRRLVVGGEALEPYISVTASVREGVEEAWVGDLINLGRQKGELKWGRVMGTLLQERGGDAARIREGLERAVVVIADPGVAFRQLDVDLARRSNTGPVLLKLIAGGPTANPAVARLGKQLRDLAAARMFDSSIIPEVERLVLVAGRYAIRRLDGLETGGVGASLRRSVLDETGGSLTKITKFSGSSHLLRLESSSTNLDPQVPLYSERLASQSLRLYGDARVVFDAGESQVTRAVETVRFTMAGIARSLSFGLHVGGRSGFVRDEDDRKEVRLQIADVAAGYARTILETFGLRGVIERFAVVVLNGRAADTEIALAYDRERSAFRSLVRG